MDVDQNPSTLRQKYGYSGNYDAYFQPDQGVHDQMLSETTKLRKALKRLAELVADEAEANPDFASALAETLGLVPAREPGATQEQKHGKGAVPNPFDLFAEKGSEGFRTWLQEQNAQDLRAIIGKYRLDPSQLSRKWKTKQRLEDLILERVAARSKQGEAFRGYSTTEVGRDNPDRASNQ